MKKTIVVGLLGLFLLPSAAFAQYHPDPQINSLLTLLIEQVKVLQAQLAALEEREEERDSRPSPEERLSRLVDERAEKQQDLDEALAEYYRKGCSYSRSRDCIAYITDNLTPIRADIKELDKKIEVVKALQD